MLNSQPTIADAATIFGVSAKTVRAWIDKGIIDTPPTMEHGLRSILVFPHEYMEKAKAQLVEFKRVRRG